MKEYWIKESWTKLCIVGPGGHMSSDFREVDPIAFLKTGNEVLMKSEGRELLSYDLEKENGKQGEEENEEESKQRLIPKEIWLGLRASPNVVFDYGKPKEFYKCIS
ncbi:hypothetical protein L484_013655 [Morus notabilis]|uniref:Uncharacterized protein n=1 Tax=Morus notabilis TaxID=981085 RepID=W9QX80_9ROSA|nr:hypothetical protein L484_013655 [Morus notabilis]